MGNQCCGEMRNADKQNGTNGAYTTVKPGDMPMDPQHTQGWGEEGQTGVVPQAPGFPGRGPPPPTGRMPMNMMRGGPPPPGPMQPTYDEYGNEIYPPQQNMAPRPSVAPFPGRGAPRPPIQQPPPQQAPPPAEPYWDDQQQQWIYPQPQAQTQGYEGQENVDEWGNPVQSTQGHEQQQNTSHDPYAQQNDPSQQHSESTGYDASQNSYSDPSSHSQSQSEPSYGEGQLSISQDSSISSRPPSQSISGRAPSASFSGGRPPSGSVARRPPPNPPVLAGQGSAPSDEGSLMGRPPSASMSVRPAPRQGPPAPGPGPAPGRAPMGRPSIGRRGPPAPQRGQPIPQQQQQTVDNYGNPIEEQPDGFSAPSPGQQQRPNPIQIPTAPTPTRSGPNNMTPLALNGSSRSGPPTPGRGPTPGRLMTQASSGRIVNLDAPPAPEFNPPPMSHSSSHESSTSSTPGAHGVSADELSHARLQPQGERRRTLSSVGHQPQKSEDLGDFLTQALIEKRNQLTGNYSTLTIPGSGTTTPPSTATGGPKKFKPPASPRLGGRQMGPPSPSPPPQEQENYSYDQNQVDPSQQSWDEQSQQQQYQQSQQQQYDDGSYQQYHNNGQQQYQEWQ